jgi:hypothetical protein
MARTRLKGGRSTSDPRLDRVPSQVTTHLEKFPFSARMADDGKYRVATDGKLGRLRGGHCLMIPARKAQDVHGWHWFYNQGTEGRCVQFGISRTMSHLRRRRYRIDESDPGRWLYWQAQMFDEWPGGSYPGGKPTYEGTSVRAGLEIVRQYGLVRDTPKSRREAPSMEEGIQAYRWILDAQDLLMATGRTGQSEIPWHNSWGTGYPRTVYVPVDVHARLIREDGEYGLPTLR